MGFRRAAVLASLGAIVATSITALVVSEMRPFQSGSQHGTLVRRLKPHDDRHSQIVLAFSLRDCTSGIERLRAWNGVRQRAPIRGVLLDEFKAAEPAHEALRRAGLLYEVGPDSRGNMRRLLAEIGHDAGPVALVFDPEGRLVRAAALSVLSGDALTDEISSLLQLAEREDIASRRVILDSPLP